MKFALINPRWTFHGSTYFGCQEAHFPIELMCAQQQLKIGGHDTLLMDAHMEGLSPEQVHERLNTFDEDILVLPTAPSYLFWRCPQPELRVTQDWVKMLRGKSTVVLIGPHGSATPFATLRKTGADIVLRGEPDQVLPMVGSASLEDIPGCCWMEHGEMRCSAGIGATEMPSIGALDYTDYPVERHTHKHHVFTEMPGLGAEVEFARGCPYSCTFCNKTLFRNKYRERPVAQVLAEIDQLISRGVTYVYFIDEIFGVGKNVVHLLDELTKRPVSIGFQTRIDLWDEDRLELLGRARCTSFECGIESITEEGRNELNKNCRLSTERISELLIHARKHIPWVQANLIKTAHDDADTVKAWQNNLKVHGVWVSEPVPMFPFPGSPEYITTFGAQPDDEAWERAHAYYLGLFADKGYSDIQEQHPVPLQELECAS
jgi:B12-binding domain/radical SAM domain protein of rhizo-twelve system